jgi:very-short-patch-repair endonuclease
MFDTDKGFILKVRDLRALNLEGRIHKFSESPGETNRTKHLESKGWIPVRFDDPD